MAVEEQGLIQFVVGEEKLLIIGKNWEKWDGKQQIHCALSAKVSLRDEDRWGGWWWSSTTRWCFLRERKEKFWYVKLPSWGTGEFNEQAMFYINGGKVDYQPALCHLTSESMVRHKDCDMNCTSSTWPNPVHFQSLIKHCILEWIANACPKFCFPFWNMQWS
jgi:hypothetical protein